MTCLAETNPALVSAALEALKSVKSASGTKETTFTHEGARWRAKIVIDYHADTIDYFSIYRA